MNENESKKIVVIYDGECEFCIESIKWIEKKIPITALPFQKIELTQYNLTYQKVSSEVHVLINSEIFSGAAAVAFLLIARGNRSLGTLLRISGPLGVRGYRWVAAHRGSILIRIATYFFRSTRNQRF